MEQRKREINDILLKYSPDKQADFASNKKSCFSNTIPTLNDLIAKYGDLAPMLWLNPQLANLAVFCNIGSILNEHTLKEFSSIMVRQYGNLKLSEIMLFFYNCKSGKYGKIFSLMDVTIALRQFVAIREDYIEREQAEEVKTEPVAWNDIKHKFNIINSAKDEDSVKRT